MGAWASRGGDSAGVKGEGELPCWDSLWGRLCGRADAGRLKARQHATLTLQAQKREEEILGIWIFR